MCGIAGSVRFRPAAQTTVINAMVRSLRHRGPDDEGIYEIPEQGAALGMTRLSIIDLSGGHQPMFDETGRYAVVFNGEIYNYRDLWRELERLGHRFATDHSDTEVIVHGFEQWGTSVFPRLNGMFAVAIWDQLEGRLVLARDRVGEKPLYLGELRGGGWVFGSEMKALLVHPDLDREIDPAAVEQFLAFDFVLGPRSILKSVRKLPAGHIATIDRESCETRPFWTPSFTAVARAAGEINEELDELLGRSVRMRMVADVPVGLFLSGGLDSTTIGYYMSRESSTVRSFSIGFEDPHFDESAEARLAAAHLGIGNDLQVFSERQVLELVPRVTELLDEPMGDESIFPTYLLSLVARKHVKVALGGDGSDELFMGYRTYQALKAAWMIEGSPLGPLARWIAGRTPVVGPKPIRRIGQLGKTLRLTPEERLLGRLGSFHGDARWVLAPPYRESAEAPALEQARIELAGPLTGAAGAAERTIGTYLRGYLQEDILVKVDRASMATSLEVRSPFLDPAIIDFALSLPASVKLRRMTRKDPIRRLMRGRLPDRIIDRPKRGFGVPLSAWLRTALAPLLDDYLSDDRLTAAGFFDPQAVISIRRRHLAGSDDAGSQLWLLLQFEMWRERWIQSTTPIRCA
jgi:asparagine synthase (glutamine-hydrolysing)